MPRRGGQTWRPERRKHRAHRMHRKTRLARKAKVGGGRKATAWGRGAA